MSASVKTFWRFTAFFRCFQVVMVCIPALLLLHHSSVIHSSPKDYVKKLKKTLDTPLTIPLLHGCIVFPFLPALVSGIDWGRSSFSELTFWDRLRL